MTRPTHPAPRAFWPAVLTLSLAPLAAIASPEADRYFERIATFPVYLNLAASEDPATQTVAEITAVSRDGRTLIYTDSPGERVGLVDISNPREPQPAGFIALEGEPTSVAVHRHFALVAVNTSLSYREPSGVLAVFDIRNPARPVRVASLPMGGQPDSIAVAPSGRYAAVAIENERDEDLNDGLIPQLPAGFLRVIDLDGAPQRWSVRDIALTGLSATAPSDPEPEYVAINDRDVAAVTLQENNHVALVDLRRGRVIRNFSAGSVDLAGVDTEENDRIEPTGVLAGKRREPDAITWVGPLLATANEGDYADAEGNEGGSRGFTLFDHNGRVWYDAGMSLEQRFIRAGHYPESRSENKGIEPEGILAARYDGRDFLFVGSERGNAVAVYDAARPWAPRFHQLLPTGMGPEGLLAIPQRNLLVVSSEEDSAEDGVRATLSIYRLGARQSSYPEIESTSDALISWGALSGLVGDRSDRDRLYAVPDSYYRASRIFAVDITRTPAVIDRQIELRKDGATVDYDLEGIAQAANSDFWLASEGDGKNKPNLLVRTAANGNVLAEYPLPDAVVAQRTANGFEGVAVRGQGASERVYVAYQREWKNDPAGWVRIGVFAPASGDWRFFHYPLDATENGWVGLSELTALDDGSLLVLERDNRQGTAAAIKRLYRIDPTGIEPASEGQAFPRLAKRLVRDLLPDLAATHGWVQEKVEGVALDRAGRLFVVTDNDGVEDATGETRFLRLGRIVR